MKIKLADLRIDGGTQPRALMNEEVISEYADILVENDSLPPVVVFHDGANHWLADGFHRYFANKKAGFIDIKADVRQGTRRDAILYSVGANSDHGLRRTTEDKRKAVITLLNDIEWSEWSDHEIAKQCHVSHMTVGRARKSMGLEKEETKFTNKHGTESTMKRPAPVTTLKPVEQIVEEQDKLQELAAAHADLADENAKLLDRIAVAAMDATEEEKVAAAATLEDLRAQIKTLEAELRAVKNSRDQFQAKNADLIKQCDYWKRRAEKLEKAA